MIDRLSCTRQPATSRVIRQVNSLLNFVELLLQGETSMLAEFFLMLCEGKLVTWQVDSAGHPLFQHLGLAVDDFLLSNVKPEPG